MMARAAMAVALTHCRAGNCAALRIRKAHWITDLM
jgi:hypothetical protein